MPVTVPTTSLTGAAEAAAEAATTTPGLTVEAVVVVAVALHLTEVVLCTEDLVETGGVAEEDLVITLEAETGLPKEAVLEVMIALSWKTVSSYRDSLST